MDFGMVAIATSQSNMEVNQEMGIGMIRRALDHTEQMGAQIVQMMQEMTVQMTGEGGNVNLSV
ncbi:MAG: putative motility protein [Defluviitaleaceae bacterium]|nr:putative motility protein [Defluviitaleaceae bacterium]MCL2261862.1 putative motility protein [Defluviitaleaceae bacterium]